MNLVLVATLLLSESTGTVALVMWALVSLSVIFATTVSRALFYVLVIPTTMPLFALRSAWEYWLMPLVTTRPGSEAAATTVPPGQTQKL